MYSNAVSFTYNNKSLSDFSHKMIIGYIDKSEDSFGLDREIVSGSTTMNRNIYHAYNTKYSGKLGFQITLFHEDQKRFTENEVSEVTRWLTSPKSYRKLEFYGCDDRKNDVVYYAIVTKVTPALAGGIAGLKIDFECNAPYGFVEKESNLFDLTNKLETPNHNGSLVLDCGSDELEQYVYPIIEVESPELWTDLQITNHSDNNSTMHLWNTKGNYEINCQHQVIKLDGQGIVLSSVFKMDTVQKLYWLRLVPGENQIEITGRCKIKIKWLEPKKVGAF